MRVGEPTNGFGQILLDGQAIGILLGDIDRISTLFRQQMPEVPAAGHHKQSGLPLGQLAAVPQEREHLLRVDAAKPLGLGHEHRPPPAVPEYRGQPTGRSSWPLMSQGSSVHPTRRWPTLYTRTARGW